MCEHLVRHEVSDLDLLLVGDVNENGVPDFSS
jgi:hypothetical protein